MHTEVYLHCITLSSITEIWYIVFDNSVTVLHRLEYADRNAVPASPHYTSFLNYKSTTVSDPKSRIQKNCKCPSSMISALYHYF